MKRDFYLATQVNEGTIAQPTTWSPGFSSILHSSRSYDEFLFDHLPRDYILSSQLHTTVKWEEVNLVVLKTTLEEKQMGGTQNVL